jgi:hypothetical protein
MIEYFHNSNSDEHINVNIPNIGSETVHQMRHSEFRQKLIDHLDIMFQRKEMQWPTRNGLMITDI